jgi:nucleoside-diphosphate-sugar epimerase
MRAVRTTDRAASDEDTREILDLVGDLFEELRGARLLVTGGTGFFGKWLLESALRADTEMRLGLRISALTRSAAAFERRAPHLFQDPRLELIEGDVRSFTPPAGPYTHIVHAATDTVGGAEADPSLVYDTVVEGTRRVLELSEKHGAAKVLFTSTGAVYAPQPAELESIPETSPVAHGIDRAVAPYPAGKIAAEALCGQAARESDGTVTIARGFAFVGPGLKLDAHFAIGNFIRDALAGGPVRVLGDGTPFRSYLYASDLAVWLWTILLRGRSGRAYNVGSGRGLCIRELAETVAAQVSPRPEVVICKEPLPGAPAERYVPSVRRAEEELGLTVRVGLDEAIRRTIAWHRGA